jgi:hypothetical protein
MNSATATGWAIEVGSLRCSRRVEGSGVGRTGHERRRERLLQAGATLADVKAERRQVDQPGDVVHVDGGLRDDGAAVGMTHEDHRTVDRGDVCGDGGASKARLRNGFGGATTECPAVCSSRITP